MRRKTNLYRIEVVLQKKEKTAEYFREGDPIWMDFKEKKVYEREEVNEIIKNYKKKHIQFINGGPSSGKSVIGLNVGYKCAVQKRYKVFIIRDVSRKEDMAMHDDIKLIDKKNYLLIIDECHLKPDFAQQIYDIVKSTKKLKALFIARPSYKIGLELEQGRIDDFRTFPSWHLKPIEVINIISQWYVNKKFNKELQQDDYEALRNLCGGDLLFLGRILKSWDGEKSWTETKRKVYGDINEDLIRLENRGNGAAASILIISQFYQFQIPIERRFLKECIKIEENTLQELVRKGDIKIDGRGVCSLHHPSKARLFLEATEYQDIEPRLLLVRKYGFPIGLFKLYFEDVIEFYSEDVDSSQARKERIKVIDWMKRLSIGKKIEKDFIKTLLSEYPELIQNFISVGNVNEELVPWSKIYLNVGKRYESKKITEQILYLIADQPDQIIPKTRFSLAMLLKEFGSNVEALEQLRFVSEHGEDPFNQLSRHASASILQNELKYCMDRKRSEEIRNDIETNYKILLTTYRDSITLQAYAIYKKEIKEFACAEQSFKESYKMDPENVPNLQAYAIFCKEQWRKYRDSNPKKATRYSTKAEELFEEGKEIAFRKKYSIEHLLNAYGIFKKEQGFIEKNETKQREKFSEADSLFKKVLEYNPIHLPTLNEYARFLSKCINKLERLQGIKSYLDEAKKYLKIALEEYDDYRTKNILGILLYRYNCPPDYPNYEQAKHLLIESTQTNNVLHNARTYHELGLLYKKMGGIEEAEQAFEKSIAVEPNSRSFIHLAIAYADFSKFLAIIKSIKDERFIKYAKLSKKYASKAGIDVAIEYENFYYIFISQGNERRQSRDYNGAIDYYKKAIDEEPEENFPYWLIGQVYKDLRDYNKAIEWQIKSAEREKTSQGYGTLVHDIKEISRMEGVKININEQNDLDLREKYLKKAIKCNRDYDKNWGDYGEALKQKGERHGNKEYTLKAIEAFKKAIKKAKKLKKNSNYYYWQIGHCYQNIDEKDMSKSYFVKGTNYENSFKGYKKLAELMYFYFEDNSGNIKALEKCIQKFDEEKINEKEKKKIRQWYKNAKQNR